MAHRSHPQVPSSKKWRRSGHQQEGPLQTLKLTAGAQDPASARKTGVLQGEAPPAAMNTEGPGGSRASEKLRPHQRKVLFLISHREVGVALIHPAPHGEQSEQASSARGALRKQSLCSLPCGHSRCITSFLFFFFSD